MRLVLAALSLILALLCAPPSAHAHSPSEAALRIEAGPDAIEVRWDIAVRDLDALLSLDADKDGSVTWGEIRSRGRDIADLGRKTLALRDADTGAELSIEETAPLALARHADGVYAVLSFRARPSPRRVAIAYTLLFDVDALHRCVVRTVRSGSSGGALVLTRAEPTRVVDLGDTGALSSIGAMLRAGFGHVSQGFDHLLFLATLLLPAVLRRRGDRWVATESFRVTIVETVKIVTAFTAAHALTLTLAVLDVVRPPARFVESAIAMSIVLAALNNLRPVVERDRWVAAFGLGLLHGFGFSAALVDLGVPRGTLASSLFGFNLGVELGQLALVALLVPLAYAARRSAFYRGPALVAGSSATLSVALVWLAERALGVPILR